MKWVRVGAAGLAGVGFCACILFSLLVSELVWWL